MTVKNNASLFIATLFLIGLLFPALSPDVAYGGFSAVGCCTTELEGGSCVACPEDENCVASQDFCESQDGFFDKGGCRTVDGSAACGPIVQTDGCCVVEPGSCVDDIDTEACFLGLSGSPELWVSNTSCSEVPECTITRNIPTMSNWGLIALAAVFVMVGVWAITRKKAEA